MKLSLILAMALLFLSGAAFADNFRCPNGSIVSSGDSISEVMVKCDPPTNKIKRTDSEETFNGRVRYIEVEEWTYNEGPNTLVHYLTFRNGVLKEIKTGTFGR
ncbi:MAG: DUF2845 domain-containing protein [Desulfobacteraceae bacterium]|nr:DUF2845 domain-containing protein [Desulfobacteraceae bacterium]